VVLLAGCRDVPDRTAAWVSRTAEGLRLWTAALPVAVDPNVPLCERAVLDGEGQPVVPADANGRVVLLEAAMGEHDWLILGAGTRLWLVDPFAERPVAVPLLDKPRLLTPVREMPGIAFIPGTNRESDEPLGMLFVACQTDTRPPRRELCLVALSPRGRDAEFSCREPNDIPCAVIGPPRSRGVLSVADDRLRLCTPGGQQVTLLIDDCLRGTVWATVSGGLAVCSGVDAVDRQKWFTLLIDLRDRSVLDLQQTPMLAAPPLLIGSWLFKLEGHVWPGDEAPSLCLTRRQIERKSD
jgi:hypothetical protein